MYNLEKRLAMIWWCWLNSVYIVSHRTAFDDVKILGIYSTFERAATIVDRLIQFRDIQQSECVVVHRTVLNATTYEGLRDRCMVVNSHDTTFSRERYQRIYTTVQRKHKNSVEL